MNYLDQIKRIRRDLNKISRFRGGKVSAFMLDNLYHLFSDLWHLKDWIKNDETIQIDKKCLDLYINDAYYLKICQSIANKSKHLKLNKQHNRYPDVKIDNYSLIFWDKTRADFLLIFSGNFQNYCKNESVLDVVEGAIKEWDFFLKRNKLFRITTENN